MIETYLLPTTHHSFSEELPVTENGEAVQKHQLII